jgi:predicted RNA-binding protein associated with RNAse of E/G family
MNPGDAVRMEYIRPGKEITYYEEDFISQDAVCLRTHKTLSQDIVERLSQALQAQNLIAADQQVLTIKKTYFFTEAFNILEFRGSNENLLGYYSDIGEPTIQLGPAEFQMTDLFLDIWLHPDGRVMELDWDEFEEAIRNHVITSTQANLARDTMKRLLAEVAHGLYPIKYL